VGSEVQLDLASEVMGLLETARNVTVPNNVKYELETILKKHMRQKEGYLKGRDIARQALEKMGEQIKELQKEDERLARGQEGGDQIEELQKEKEKLVRENEKLKTRVDTLTVDVNKMCKKLQATSLEQQTK